jgi:hypothetical protein
MTQRLVKHSSRQLREGPTQGRWMKFLRWKRMNKTQRAAYLRAKPPAKKR